MKTRIVAFLIPVLAILIPLYQALANLRIAVTRPETLAIIGTLLGVAVFVGFLAAIANQRLRMVVYALTTLFVLDLTLGMGDFFDALAPQNDPMRVKDAARIADLMHIREALESYLLKEGSLPRPHEYEEHNVSPSFWDGWWDLSTADRNADGNYFLDFLVDSEVLQSVPVDPDNQPLGSNSGPATGKRYVYYLVPPRHNYRGGSCMADRGQPVYMLAITELESDSPRLPSGSGCDCLWSNAENYFQSYFDYVLCGIAATVTRPGRLAGESSARVDTPGAGDFFPGRLLLRKTTPAKVGEGEIELLSSRGAVLAAVSGSLFLEDGALWMERDGHFVVEGGVEGEDDIARYLEVHLEDQADGADLGDSGKVRVLTATLDFPGAIARGSVEIEFESSPDGEPPSARLEIIDPGSGQSGTTTLVASQDSAALEWTWEPAREDMSAVQMRVRFPDNQRPRDVQAFRFRLEGSSSEPYWEPAHRPLALTNSTKQDFQLEWIGYTRL